jgi:hypothetical protein
MLHFLAFRPKAPRLLVASSSMGDGKPLLRGQRGNQPKISEAVARKVIAKLRAGKTSVSGEAVRLGVYHATLRKAMRAILGDKEFTRIVVRGRRAELRKPKAPVQKPRRRPEAVKKKAADKPYMSAPSFSHVEGEWNCGRCGSEQIQSGTNGIGGAVLWCSCGWSAPIPRVQASAIIAAG